MLYNSEQKHKQKGEPMSERMRSPELSHSDSVRVGSTVEIQFVDEAEDDIEIIQIVDRPGQEKPNDRLRTVSLGSPIGRVIVGTKPGDIITYSAPGGVTVRIRIVSVI